MVEDDVPLFIRLHNCLPRITLCKHILRTAKYNKHHILLAAPTIQGGSQAGTGSRDKHTCTTSVDDSGNLVGACVQSCQPIFPFGLHCKPLAWLGAGVTSPVVEESMLQVIYKTTINTLAFSIQVNMQLAWWRFSLKYLRQWVSSSLV